MADTTLQFTRLGFPVLLEPKPLVQNGRALGDPRYSANVHLAEDPAVVRTVMEMVWAAYNATFPDPASRPPFLADPNNPLTWFNKNHKTQQVSGGIRLPLVWGPAEYPDDPNATGWIILAAASATQPPALFGPDRQPLGERERTLLFPGCEAHVNVSIYGYKQGSVGIAAGINGVMLTGRDVGRFDSRPTVAQMFGDAPVSMPSQGFGAPAQPGYVPPQAPQGFGAPAPAQQGYVPPQAPQGNPFA